MKKKLTIELIWENKVGDNDAHNLNLIFSEEFVIAATSDGSCEKCKWQQVKLFGKKKFLKK